MALKYHLVKRRDMRKEAREGDMLYYGQVRNGNKLTLDEICVQIADMSTATSGDIKCVLEGLVKVMKAALLKGDIVQLNGVGSFRMSAGSQGVEKEEDFHTSLFKKGRILFKPGEALSELGSKVRFEKLDVKTVIEIEECGEDHA